VEETGIPQQNFIERLGFVPVLTSPGCLPRLSIATAKREVAMTHDEMTIAEVLKDPLIRQMMRADRVSLREMKKLLREAEGGQRLLKKIRPLSEAAGSACATPSGRQSLPMLPSISSAATG
jgi:hypothetical protein